MRSLFCVLVCVIFLFGRNHAANELTPECYMQLYQQSLRVDECTEMGSEVQMKQKERDLKNDFNQITSNNSNVDENLARIFINKYCTLGRKLLDCYPIGRQNLTDGCLEQKYANQSIFRERIMDIILDYICDNDAVNFFKSLQNKGYQIWHDQSFLACFDSKQNIKLGFVDGDVFQVNPAWCTASRSLKDCVVNTLSTHPNTELPNLAIGLHRKLFDEGGFDSC